MILTISTQKGGVGKTTTSTALTNSLHHLGHKVLLIDNDPQCNATDTYRATVDGHATVYDLMTKNASAEEAIQTTSYGDIIACDPLLKKADNEFLSADRNFLLKEALEPIKDQYDYIIIDTNPGLGILMVNALTVCDHLIVPITAGRYSLQGLQELLSTLISVRKYANHDLHVLGLLVTMHQDGTNISRDLLHTLPQIEEMFSVKTFKTKIHQTVKVKEAEGARTPLIEYAPQCTASEDYIQLTNEILERTGEYNG